MGYRLVDIVTPASNPAPSPTRTRRPQTSRHAQTLPPQVQKAFSQFRAKVAQRLPAASKTRLRANTALHDTQRHFAAAEHHRGTLTVYIDPRLGQQPLRVIRGVIAHEFGHIVQFITGRPTDGDYTTVEREADTLAERYLGVRISYSAKGTQTTGRGIRPRPRGWR